MATVIIIVICALLLLAYVFDITSAKTKVPSIILLLILGWLCKYFTTFIGFSLPDLNPVLTILGTIGLILIVLEGSLELNITTKSWVIIKKSFFIALLSMVLISIFLGYAFYYFSGASLRICIINTIPFAIISSAIAIPSAKNFPAHSREFITYESSLSDIFGVIAFNFIMINNIFSMKSISGFIFDILLILIITFIATLALAYLLSKIKHHVKFAPIILLVILIYAISKVFHLPALVFILIFGLFIQNLDELKSFSFISKLHPEILEKEVHKLKELNSEMVFLIRSLFFLLFGSIIEISELSNPATLMWSLSIIAGIFVIRYLLLKLTRMYSFPLLFMAPRGLITILLFLSIPINSRLQLADQSLIMQVIVLSALIMMLSSMKSIKSKFRHENY